jgi:hypothetical protein
MTDISPPALRTVTDRILADMEDKTFPASLADAIDALNAIADRDEAAGWVRVPVEPTEAMIEAGDSAAEPSGRRVDGAVIENWSEVYRAMIAAAQEGAGDV